MIARVLALVLALLLVGGGVAAYAAPVAPDATVELADLGEVTIPAPPAIAPAPRTVTALPDLPAPPPGRAHVDAVFRPPRLVTSR